MAGVAGQSHRHSTAPQQKPDLLTAGVLVRSKELSKVFIFSQITLTVTALQGLDETLLVE